MLSMTNATNNQFNPHNVTDVNFADNLQRSLLHWYAWHGNKEAVQYLLDNQADPNIRNAWGWTPLHCAVHENHIQIVQLLLFYKADISIVSQNDLLNCPPGFSPLSLALRLGHHEIVRLLQGNDEESDNNLEDDIENENDEGDESDSIEKFLKLAMQKLFDPDIDENTKLELLLMIQMLQAQTGDNGQREASPVKELERARNQKANQDFLKAAKMGRSMYRALQDALRQGFDPNVTDEQTQQSALQIIISSLDVSSNNGHEKIVEEFLQHGANPNLQDGDGWTALHYAVIKKSVYVVRVLLQAGADLAITSTKTARALDMEFLAGETALDFAKRFEAEQEEMLFLLNRHAEISSDQGPVVKATDLTWSVICGDLQQAEVFLQQGNSPNINYRGMPLLVFAAKNLDYSMVELLIKYQADIHAVEESSQRTALHYVAMSGDHILAARLLRAGVKVNACDKWGETALFDAINTPPATCIQLVQLLLAHGADIHARNPQDAPVFLSIVKQTNQNIQNELFSLAVKHGADINVQDDDGNTLFHLALEQGLLQLVERLIQSGANTQLRNKKHQSIIQLAESKKMMDIVMRLRARRCEDLGIEDLSSVSQMFLNAAQNNDTRTLLSLLTTAEPNVTLEDSEKMTAMHWVIWHNNIEVLRAFLDFYQQPNLQNSNSFSLLYFAVFRRNFAAVKLLIEFDADSLHAPGFVSLKGYTSLSVSSVELSNRLQYPEIFSVLQASSRRCAEAIALDSNFSADTLELYCALRSCDYDAFSACLKTKQPDLMVYDKNEWPLVLYATELSDIRFLQAFASTEALRLTNRTRESNALDCAARTGDLTMVRYLIEDLKFDPSRQRPKDGSTPFHGAAVCGHLPIVQYLCEVAKVDISIKTHEQRNGLTDAISNGYVEVVTYLESRIDQKFWRERDSYGQNLFFIVAGNGSIALFNIICAHLQDQQIKKMLNQPKNNGWTPLMYACSLGHAKLADLMIKKGADPHYKKTEDCDYQYWNALMAAIANKRLTSVEVLLRHNVDPNFYILHNSSDKQNQGYGWSPLEYASNLGAVDIVSALIKYVKNVDLRDGRQIGDTALIAACRTYNLELVKLLVESGANINAMNKDTGSTPLICAIKYGWNAGIAYLLAQPSIDPNLVLNDTRFSAPISIATKYGVEPVRLLLSHPRTNPNFSRINISPPLISSLESCNLEVVTLLIADARVNVFAVDGLGLSALDWAEIRGFAEFKAKLLAAMRIQADSRRANAEDSIIALVQNNDFQHLTQLRLSGESRQDVNEKDTHSKMTALQYAALLGYVECLKELLQFDDLELNKAHPESGNTALHFAVLANRPEIVKLLVNSEGIKVNLTNSMWETPLALAAEGGNAACAEILLAHSDINPNLSRAILGNDGTSPLHTVIDRYLKVMSGGAQLPPIHPRSEREYLKTFLLIFNHPKTKPNQASALWQSHMTPLMRAVNSAEMVRVFLNHPDIVVNRLSKGGWSAFNQAISEQAMGAVYALLARRDTDINLASDDRKTPLITAVITGCLESVQTLLTSSHIRINAQINDRHNKNDKFSALHFAVQKNRLDMCKALLAYSGIDVDLKAVGEITPLILAATAGYLDIVKLLMAYGARLDLADKHGFTARFLASREGHFEVAALLLAAEQELEAERRRLKEEELTIKIEAIDQVILERKKSQRVQLERTVSDLSKQVANITQVLQQHSEGFKILMEDRARMLAERQQSQQFTEAEKYLENDVLLKSFHTQLVSRMTGILIAYHTLASGLVASGGTTTDTVVHSVINLLGGSIPLLGSVSVELLNIGYDMLRAAQNDPVYQFIISLFPSIKAMSLQIDIIARLTTYKFEVQIQQLASEEVARAFAEYIAGSYLTILQEKTINRQNSICAQLLRGLFTSPKKNMFSFLWESTFATKPENELKEWKASLLLQQSILMTSEGISFSANASNDLSYLYHFGTENEASELNYSKTAECADIVSTIKLHPLCKNPFRFQEEILLIDEPPVVTWVQMLENLNHAHSECIQSITSIEFHSKEVLLNFNSDITRKSLLLFVKAFSEQSKQISDDIQQPSTTRLDRNTLHITMLDEIDAELLAILLNEKYKFEKEKVESILKEKEEPGSSNNEAKKSSSRIAVVDDSMLISSAGMFSVPNTQEVAVVSANRCSMCVLM